jgi:hypothetical protein
MRGAPHSGFSMLIRRINAQLRVELRSPSYARTGVAAATVRLRVAVAVTLLASVTVTV